MLLGLSVGFATGSVKAGENTLAISQTRVAPALRAADTPVFMTITNTGAADVLLRTRCPAANFSEMHTVDHGEGSPAMRVVKSIPIAANGVTQLNSDGYHVMLLQIGHDLVGGETFSCSVTFRDAGKQDVEGAVGAAQ